MNSPFRIGNFTSSEIVALTANGKAKGTLGKPAYTYIEDCNMERRLGRPLTNESNARPLSWGKLCEGIVFQLLGLEYTLCSTETLQHPEIDCWSGSPDALKHVEWKTVADIKCPMTLKSFCTLIDSWEEGGFDAIRKNHKDGEKYYWQLVSNAVLTDSKFAELIVYAPYWNELQSIRQIAEGNPKYYWVWSSQDEELPFLIPGGHYKNLNVMRFEVPQADKDFLRERVLIGKELLIQPKLIAA